MKQPFALAIITVMLSVSAYCQNNNETRLFDEYEIASHGRQFHKQNRGAKGSPYLNKFFAYAKVSNVAKNAMLRYDVFNDEFEFVNTKNDTLVLDKTEKFNTITFTVTNTKYALVDYTNNKGKATTGYLIWLYEKNDFVLFKKQNVIYTKEETSETPFAKNSPASYDRIEDNFYFKSKDKGIVEFPSNKKGLVKLFPEKKTDLEAFIKKNDIDFDKEADLVKIVDFLAI